METHDQTASPPNLTSSASPFLFQLLALVPIFLWFKFKFYHTLVPRNTLFTILVAFVETCHLTIPSWMDYCICIRRDLPLVSCSLARFHPCISIAPPTHTSSPNRIH